MPLPIQSRTLSLSFALLCRLTVQQHVYWLHRDHPSHWWLLLCEIHQAIVTRARGVHSSLTQRLCLYIYIPYCSRVISIAYTYNTFQINWKVKESKKKWNAKHKRMLRVYMYFYCVAVAHKSQLCVTMTRIHFARACVCLWVEIVALFERKRYTKCTHRDRERERRKKHTK